MRTLPWCRCGDVVYSVSVYFFFSSRRRHTRCSRDWSSDVCSSDLTWSQQLKLHPHVHCVAPAGGFSPDRARWMCSRKNYFLPKKVLRKVFRGKFVNALEQAFQDGLLRFEGNLKLLAKIGRAHV